MSLKELQDRIATVESIAYKCGALDGLAYTFCEMNDWNASEDDEHKVRKRLRAMTMIEAVAVYVHGEDAWKQAIEKAAG